MTSTCIGTTLICRRGPIRQTGRTLIEVIIALAISLVIVMGVGSLYLSSSQVSRTANQLGSAEEAGQFSMYVIGQSLRLSGYGEIVGSDYSPRAQTLFDGAHVRACTNGRFTDVTVNPPDLNCVAGGTGDALFVRFQADSVLTVPQGPIRNCIGNDPANEQMDPTVLRAGSGVFRPMVQNVFQMNGANQLTCRGDGAGFQPFIQDVLDFKVFFGFDDAAYNAAAAGITNAAPLGGTVRTAADLIGFAAATPAVDPWEYVVAVHVCITVRTPEGVGGTLTTPSRCPQDAAEATSGAALTSVGITDGMLRRTFRQVFTVRSRATATPSLTL